MMTRNVSAKTISSLRSIPGSCCGLLNSAKSVAHHFFVSRFVSGHRFSDAEFLPPSEGPSGSERWGGLFGPRHPSPPDPARPSPADGTEKPAKPRSPRRATRHTAPPLPSRIPNTSAHSGTTAETTAKSTVCKAEAARARETSFLCLHQLLRNHIHGPAHFFEHHRKFERQHRLLRIDHHINRARTLQHRTPEPHRFAQPPLDPVPLHRAAQHLAHCEPDARTFLRYSALRRTALRLPQIKHRHVRGKMPPPLLVHALEVSVFLQARRARKACSRVRRGLLYP